MRKKTAILPVSGEEGKGRSSKDAIEHVIATKTPVAARHGDDIRARVSMEQHPQSMLKF